MFQRLFDKVMVLASHQRAPMYLAGVSFVESSFFPIPPDVMLVPMSLAKPESAWRFVLVATLFSVIGGLLGYLIGYGFIEIVHPYIIQAGYGALYNTAIDWFTRWGSWIILLAGFTPIPYKLFTIAAGSMHMSLLPFIIFSILGRGSRFSLVAFLSAWGGPKAISFLNKNINRIGWLILVLAGLGYLIYQLWSRA